MNSEKHNLYERVDRLRGSLHIPFNEPIDSITLIESSPRIDLEYIPFKTHGFCGIAMVGEKIDTIALNSNRTYEEQNFDGAHELMHLYQHRNITQRFNCFSIKKPQQDSFLEWQANEGAAQFLVPYQDFIPRFLDLYYSARYDEDRDLRDILADFYHVTTPVIHHRIDSLNYEIHQYERGIPLSELEILSKRQRNQRGIIDIAYNAGCDFPFYFDSIIG